MLDKIFAPEVLALLGDIPIWVPLVGMAASAVIAVHAASQFMVKDPGPKMALAAIAFIGCGAWIALGY